MISALLVAGMVSAKDRRTYYDDDVMARVRQRVREHAWARGQVESAKGGAAWLLELSEQELWDFVPPPEQIRAINVCIAHDCPICGDEITRKAGHYPWIMNRERPFKLKCPVCKRWFPENDFEPWNTEGVPGKPETGERIVDKGLGWVGPDGRRYYFVPYYIFWQRWCRDILSGMSALGRAYLLTDEPVYARKCAVMMAKLASEYERFDYGSQAYHEGRWPAGLKGRISDRIWTTGNDSTIALAYDAIYPALRTDAELLAFLKTKGIEAPAALIEKKMLQVMVNDVYTEAAAGNMGMHQKTLAHLAIVLDNDDPEKGPTTQQMRDWIMAGPGRVEDLLWNGFWRDGLGSESSPSYASSWCGNFYALAEMLPKIGVDIWSNPKMKRMADIGLDMTVAGKFCPDIGDSGGLKGSGPIGVRASLQGPAFAHYKDPRHAKALLRMGATWTDLFTEGFDPEEVKRAAAGDVDMGWRTRNIGGYGLAVLESGGEGQRRAATMYYGYAGGGHGHHDRLTIEMWAYGRPVLPDDGYPFPFTRPNFYNWRGLNTFKHYCVVVDQTTQRTVHAGALNTLAASPEIQLMDASAEIAYDSMVSLYRRTTALIDVSIQDSYLLDIFRVRGGQQHDWCFHGPPFPEYSVTGVPLGPVQEKGTLAGENVAFGAKPGTTVTQYGVTLDLLEAQGLLTGEYGPVSRQGWAVFGQCILTRKKDATVRLGTPSLAPGKVRVYVRMYDYNQGGNRLDVDVGGVTASLRSEPSGARGYCWVSDVVELAAPAAEVVLKAVEIGQKYIQIDRFVISRLVNRKTPLSAGAGLNGFHGLYNVRRGNPSGAWSAAWSDPEDKVSLTMTMAPGCVQEVITANGQPELQPGNPDEIQYVLGRNILPLEEAQAGRQLLSKYAAVIEPHRGPPTVEAVTPLRAATASAETVGLAVRRQGAVDLIHSSLDPDERCEWEGLDEPLVVAAEFAVLTLGDRGVERAFVVNGTLLQWGAFALKPSPAPAGKVLAVDCGRNTIVIDAALPKPELFRDSVIILGNDLHQSSYTIKEARATDEGTALSFGDVLFIVGMGEVAKTDQAAGVVTSDRSLSGYGRTDGGRHAGRWLFNDDKSAGFRIEAVRGATLRLGNVDADLEATFGDKDGDGRRRYWICDIGPGDAFRLPSTTYYSR